MKVRDDLPGAARRAGFPGLSSGREKVESALRSRFAGAAALGTFESTRSGFSLRLAVAGELPELGIEMRFEDGWMLCVAKLPVAGRSAAKLSATQLAEASAGLPGGVKLAYAGDAARPLRPELRAEVPLDAGVDLDAVLCALLEGFAEGARRLAAQPTATATSALSPPRSTPPGAVFRHETERCARALAEGGWTISTREDGRVFVDLEVGEGYRQALLETGPDGELRLGSELPAPLEPPPSPCADALSIATLLTSGWLRMVRGVYDGTFRLEVPLFPGLGDEAVRTAAAALSVAQRMLGDEAEILALDSAVASHYARGCARPALPHSAKRREASSRPEPPPEAETRAKLPFAEV